MFKQIKKAKRLARKAGRLFFMAREDIPVALDGLEKARIRAQQYLSVRDTARILGNSSLVVFQKINDKRRKDGSK